MSYESESVLGEPARPRDVREFVELLGYKKIATASSKQYGMLEQYQYFEAVDYRSWTGVWLTIRVKAPSLIVSTRSTAGRSYHDLEQQNRTIAHLRKRFGGYFRTDAGKGRYMRHASAPPEPADSGCYIAFQRFGHNLIQGKNYLDARTFPRAHDTELDELLLQMGISPRLLSNNMLVPYIVAALEDYFKSTFIALLKYSPRKQSFFKGLRLQGDHLAAISDGHSVESQVAEILPFQSISSVARHFATIDPKLDIAGPLKKPFRRRKQSLYDLMEMLTLSRHNFIHRTQLDLSLTDERMDNLIYDLEEAITRVYKRIVAYHKWDFRPSWGLGRKAAARKYRAQKIQQSAGDVPTSAHH